jgi:tetratricopeptide (TPR) repeat protein
MNINKNLTIEEAFNLAVQSHQAGKTDIAQELYNRVLKIDANYVAAHNNLGNIFIELGEHQKAKDCYEKTIEINPNYINAHYNLGVIFTESKEYQKAKSCYEKTIEINPNYINAHYNLGVIFKVLKEYQKAKSCYEKAIEIDPNYVNAHYNLGNLFKELGENQKAKECYEKTIELNPKHIDAHYNLGIALFVTRQYKNAAEHFKLINYKNSKSFLLQCLYKIEDKSNFFKELDYLIKQGENNPIIGSLISRSEIKYRIKKLNPFCGDPLKYILITNLTKEYNFKNIFVEPIKSALKEDMFSTKTQGLLKNGYQTAGNIFAKKNDFFDKIKDIIHLQIKKYQDLFKESNEGFIKNWPKSYDIYAWLVNMKTGGKLAPHIHEYGWLSGSIYINVPPKLEADSGNLVVCINDQVSESENKINPKKTIDVVTGSLCLFPSSLYHYTIPFESKEERIVLAFDVKPDYLK